MVPPSVCPAIRRRLSGLSVHSGRALPASAEDPEGQLRRAPERRKPTAEREICLAVPCHCQRLLGVEAERDEAVVAPEVHATLLVDSVIRYLMLLDRCGLDVHLDRSSPLDVWCHVQRVAPTVKQPLIAR